ncbi:hypothetical protein E4O65_03510, partial [Neisseria meningitidis]|nr:hypothetical protein [Neisseria meningitidis]
AKAGIRFVGFRFFLSFGQLLESSFPHRWESRSVRTGTYAPSFPRKRKSRPFGIRNLSDKTVSLDSTS